jgi:hypothetical protein
MQFATSRVSKMRSSFRNTNPLDPVYTVASPKCPHGAFPVAPVESCTKEGHVFERQRHPDWSFTRGTFPLENQNLDIEGSTPKPQYQRV